ncbi:MAG: HlyD family efflux transporter periplasmic adaptor subunit [Marinobacter sp.]|uniref:HlyD family efflux transporter periplasmic adaptor subunit n=4 Tax=Marinobacter sp. TaxID=50741 RepID=UPI00329996EC
MTEASSNPNWPLLAKLRPRLRKHVRTYPRQYRGERWYLLRDQTSGRHLRFNASAYEFIGRLDGEHSVEEICNKAFAVLGDDAPSQDDVVLILTQLFAMDLLRSELPSEAKEFFNRFQNDRRMRVQRAIMNPLAIRIPLLDPDAILNRMMPWVRPVFSPMGAAVWLLIVGLAGILGLANIPEISASVNADVLLSANLILMLVTFVVIKAIHEFAHAFTVKMWGGEVHEMGITLLVLAPVPYVDASAAWEIADKYKRALVGAVGVLVELFVAGLALFVWLAVEPGLLRDLAFNALLIGTVSTLLFNANPLLRFDGYYVLQDLVEIPNLYTRASRYYLYLIQRYLFGIESARSPVTADGEAIWFGVYGLAALVYRLFILFVIVIFLAEEYLVVGVALGVWALGMQLLLPLFRGVRFLFEGRQLAGRRVRAASVSVVSVSVICAGLLLVPVSLTSYAEGVVGVREQAVLYSGAEGFVAEVLVEPGTPVDANTPLIRMQALSLETKIEKLEARRRELQIRSAAERMKRRVQSEMANAELRSVDAELVMLKEQKASLTVRSQVSGVFVLSDENRFVGRYLDKGELIGYVISPANLIVRAVVPQSKIGLVREQVAQVEVRFAERLSKTVAASISRQTPAGSKVLPSRALGTVGGGNIAVKKSEASGTMAAEEVFHVDLSLPANLDLAGVGERAYVRFDHGSEPLAGQWLRNGRQLLLSRLSY